MELVGSPAASLAAAKSLTNMYISSVLPFLGKILNKRTPFDVIAAITVIVRVRLGTLFTALLPRRDLP